jgi:hypothetical protein
MESVELKPIIIVPKSEKQKSLIEIFLKALDLEWNDETKMSEIEYFKKLDNALEQAKKGKVTRVKSKEELQSFLDSL